MILENFSESIIERIKSNLEIIHDKTRVANFIAPDQSPPFIEVKIATFDQAIGQKTFTVHVNIKIVSAYCGDQELQKLHTNLVNQLAQQPFKDKTQRKIIQGRLRQNERRFENNGRIQIDNMLFAFFVAPLH